MTGSNWTIVWGSDFYFDLRPAVPGARDVPASDEALNGVWSSKATAAEMAMAQLNVAKWNAAKSIKRAQAIIRRESRKRAAA